MEKYLIDVLGTVLGVSAAMVLYGTFWNKKSLKSYRYYGGIILLAAVGAMITVLFQNTVILSVATLLTMFILSFFFLSGLTSKILFTFIISAILFVTEQIIGIIILFVVRIPIELVQINITLYMVGVISSKLFALFTVLIFRTIMKGNKGEGNNQFNIIMAVMPIQSIIICFVVSVYSITEGITETIPLGVIAILVSLFLVFLVMILLKNQQKAFQYKNEYDLSQQRLKMQIKHYQKLYSTQYDIRLIRHNISDKLVAISGLLSKNMISEAIERINGIDNEVKKTAEIVNTGLPPIDAVIYAKTSKALNAGIDIDHKILVDNELLVDQFDVAILIANALDNAIEGILRSSDIERVIRLDLISVSDYLSILVENKATGLIYNDLRTSKSEKINHGFGIEHMREIARKYNGDINPKYNPETKLFTLDILLKNMQI